MLPTQTDNSMGDVGWVERSDTQQSRSMNGSDGYRYAPPILPGYGT